MAFTKVKKLGLFRHSIQTFMSSTTQSKVYLDIDYKCHQMPGLSHGHDSYFIHNNTFGVADGVGGWVREGGDPYQFAKHFTDQCIIAAQLNDTSNTSINSKDILLKASKSAMNSTILGGCTALVCSLINNSILSIANLGDSRVFIYRYYQDIGYNIYFTSNEQIGYSNAPLQLGPKNVMDSGTSLACDPNIWCEYFEIPLFNNDIIICCTDGVSDNLFPHEIGMIAVNSLFKDKNDIKTTANNIVNESLNKQNGTSTHKDTPFGHPKPDDTTCVVALTKVQK